jgi:hypothetical protein
MRKAAAEQDKRKRVRKGQEQIEKSSTGGGKGYIGGYGFNKGGLAKMKTKPTKKRKGGLASKKK